MNKGSVSIMGEDREKLFAKRPGDQCVVKVIGTITGMNLESVQIDIDSVEVEEYAGTMEDAHKRAEAKMARLDGKPPIVRAAVEPYPG